jgi:exonuclease SbcC
MQERAKSLDDKRKLVLEIEKHQAGIKKEIGAANAKKMKLAEEIKGKGASEAEFEKAKAGHEKALNEFHKTEIEYNSFLKEKEGAQGLLEEIRKELEKKAEAKERLKKVKDAQHWLEEFFISLAASIEKQVMANVFHQFNSIFHDWFKMLIEDETINSRLDDTFTPVVVQNGFETGVDNLSGGEKTSCALAYRLALNKVINGMITGIRTKDLIILDEPTDGFSSEQLDKVRDVLEELNMRQVIIVSHEPKIESFVDSVIRIQKNEHISQVLI